MAGCMMWQTACPQSTLIHSPLSSPSVRGTGKPAALTSSRTLLASALVWRLLEPAAMMTRSNRGDRCSVLRTRMSWAFTSSRPSTMARCSLRMSMRGAGRSGPVKTVLVNIARHFRADQRGNRLAGGDHLADAGGADGVLGHRQHHPAVVAGVPAGRRPGLLAIARGDGKLHQSPPLCRIPPSGEVGVLVLADHQPQFTPRLLGAQLGHGVPGVARAGPVQLARVEL